MNNYSFIKLFTFLFLIGVCNMNTAQLKIAQWNDYLPLNHGESVIQGDNQIFLITSTGIFYLDKETNSYNVLSCVNDIVQTGITSSAYAKSTKDLIIGYGDGLIVLYNNGQIYTNDEIKRKNFTGSSSINKIFVDGDYAYLATDFGIVKFNLRRREIVETYPISSTNVSKRFIDVIVTDNYIGAITNNELYVANKNSANLIDYRSWSLVYTTLNSETLNSLIQYQGKIHAGLTNNTKTDALIVFNNVSIERKELNLDNIYQLSFVDENLYICANNALYSLDINYDIVKKIDRYTTEDHVITAINPKDILIDGGQIYIADYRLGLVYYNEILSTYYSPNRPISINSTTIDISNSNVLVSTGYYTSEGTYIDPVLHVKRQDAWKITPRNEDKAYSGFHTYINAKFMKGRDSVYFVGCYGTGLLKYSNDRIVSFYDQSNSPMQKPGWGIWGLSFDKDNYLWMTNSLTEKPLLALLDKHLNNGQDKWLTFNYPGLVKTGVFLEGIFIDSRNYKWIDMKQLGVFVIDDNGTKENDADDQYRGFFTKNIDTDPRNVGALAIIDEDGVELDNNFNAIAEDKDGYMWFGSDQGIYVMYRAYAVFDDEVPVFSKIKIPRNDGTDDADYLLDDLKITAIKVDGANRKWIGTESSGLFLVSEDGTKTIDEFNTDNSPLISNTITSINIDEKTGEVYIGTSKGIVSFVGTATSGQKEFTKVYAYPNPVVSSYQGVITIKGLMTDSNVKIVDISGNLVYETTSLGGSAVWDGKNSWGSKVSTGVYLVYVASPDGLESEATKILMIKDK